jgi:predicted transcriptional regulator
LSTKKTVRELLDRMPDDCSLDDVLYHLYVMQSIEQGKADAKSGSTLSHEDVARELRKKWQAEGVE